MLKLLGTFDIISALTMFAVVGGTSGLPAGFVIFISLYLIIKGIFFMFSNFDFSNLLDIIAGSTVLLTIFLIPPAIILIILAFYEGLKGISTLAA